ncbi:MAG: hypothetical protein LBD45_02725, partial [Bacteroidales bacterium]|nr:hypothetical protein [Bacteroidales bacterium]
MKKYVIAASIILVTLCWNTGLMAQDLTIVHTTAGDFANEKAQALADAGKDASEITELTINGSVVFNATDIP